MCLQLLYGSAHAHITDVIAPLVMQVVNNAELIVGCCRNARGSTPIPQVPALPALAMDIIHSLALVGVVCKHKGVTWTQLLPLHLASWLLVLTTSAALDLRCRARFLRSRRVADGSGAGGGSDGGGRGLPRTLHNAMLEPRNQGVGACKMAHALCGHDEIIASSSSSGSAG